MDSGIDQKKIKLKVYMSYFQDGLWDVVLGIFLLGWGLAVLFDLNWLPGGVFVAFFWLALGLKKKITYPRIGFSRPVERRKQMIRLTIAGAVSLTLGIFVLGAFAAGDTFQWLRSYFELLFNSMLALAILLIGYWWRIVRWYAYGGLVFIFAAFNQWLGLSFELSFIIPGAIVLLCGMLVFFRFLRKYPIMSTEDFGGSR